MEDREHASVDKRGSSPRKRPLVVGEVLFDVMPDGRRVLGGAPFNVAWHLQAFGLRPLLITRVGVDDEGDEVVAAMASWGMDRSGVQRDRSAPTGRVEVELDRGEPTFHIVPNQAWDYLDRDLAVQSAAGVPLSLLYHGSLITRGNVARSALFGVKEATGLQPFVDVNLRDPWWKRDDVLALVHWARWVKLNQAELGLIAGAPDLADAEPFRERHDLDTVVVTRGARGAAVVDRNGIVQAAPPTDIRVVDTVGAGDAFSAVFLLGLVKGWPADVVLERALEFAAAVCRQPGATTRDRRMYSGFQERGWW